MKHGRNLKRYWAVIFLLISFLTGGCGVAVHKPLDADMVNQTYESTILSRIPKEEICIHLEEKQYTSTGGGLLWVMIDKGINKARGSAAEKRIAPLLEAAADVDFRTHYWKELENALSNSSWLKIKRLDKRSLGYEKEKIAAMETPFLVLSTFYELSPNSQVLLVQTKANLYLHDLQKPDYFGFHTYYSDKIGTNGEKDDKAIALWAANNASAYRKSLADGIEQNMYMLRLDLFDKPADPKNEEGKEVKLRIRSPISGSLETLQGRELKRRENRIVMREKGGNLFSVGMDLQE